MYNTKNTKLVNLIAAIIVSTTVLTILLLLYYGGVYLDSIYHFNPKGIFAALFVIWLFYMKFKYKLKP